MNIEQYDWDRLKIIFKLLDDNKCDSIAFAKKSMYEQYKQLGYNVEFLANTTNIDFDKKKATKQDDHVVVGVYSSGNRWVKNTYNQLSAASLIKNASVDMIPLSQKDKEFASLLKLEITGKEDTVSHEEMLERISKCDIVLYTTFVECAPILPLECLELGVLCLTGDNHHYWDDCPELKDYLVEPRVDNPVAIAKHAEYSLAHKAEIMKLYAKWKKQYDKECARNLDDFLDISGN